jgi:hypothetical protein
VLFDVKTSGRIDCCVEHDVERAADMDHVSGFRYDQKSIELHGTVENDRRDGPILEALDTQLRHDILPSSWVIEIVVKETRCLLPPAFGASTSIESWIGPMAA